MGTITARESIIGAVTAGVDIASVSAGGSILGNLTAGEDIGNVTAGIQYGGSISGQITAGGNVGNLLAYGLGGPNGSLSTLPSPGTTLGDPNLWVIDSQTDQYAHGALPVERAISPEFANGGNITGHVTAGGDIGAVTAFGRIDGAVTAVGSIGYNTLTGVWALEQITGAVTAGEFGMTVQSWQGISGDVSAPGDLSVWAYDSITGNLTSTEGHIRVGSWHDVRGGVDAHRSVDVRAFDQVGTEGKIIRSRTEPARVFAGQDMDARVEAEEYVAVYAGGSITNDLESRAGDVWAEVKQDITLTAATAYDDLWVTALYGSAIGEFTAETDRALLWANVDVGSEVTAQTKAAVSVYRSVIAPARVGCRVTALRTPGVIGTCGCTVMVGLS